MQVILQVLCLSVLAVPGFGQAGKQKAAVSVRTSVGMEGEYFLRHRHDQLRAKPLVGKSPIVLRIAEISADGAAFLYDLRFIGEVEGKYDLRNWLQRSDGKMLVGVEPILVQISSVLPLSHQGELKALKAPPQPRFGGYHLFLWCIGIAWVLPVLWMIARRLARRKKKFEDSTSKAGPNLADQLRPLIEAAIRGELGLRERAHLELMLLDYWRERLDLSELPIEEALRQMKQHDEAGKLLRALENWLHRKPGTAQVDVERVLAPYRDVPVIELPKDLALQVPSAPGRSREEMSA